MARKETEKHILAFELWYMHGKEIGPTLAALREQNPPIAISDDTLRRWGRNYDWDNRVRERDLAVAKKMEADSIAQQVEFRKRQLNTGRVLQKAGLTYFLDKDGKVIDGKITNEFGAMQAIKVGSEMEANGLGMGEESFKVGDVTIKVVHDRSDREVIEGTATSIEPAKLRRNTRSRKALPSGQSSISAHENSAPETAGDSEQQGEA
jgi:hypothetical protein